MKVETTRVYQVTLSEQEAEELLIAIGLSTDKRLMDLYKALAKEVNQCSTGNRGW